MKNAITKLISTPFLKRYWLFLMIDAFVVIFSYWFSLFLRLENTNLEPFFDHFLESLPVVVFIHILVLHLFQNYRLSWLYVDMNTAISIGKSVVVSVLVCLSVLFLFGKSNYLPKSIPAIFGVNVFFLLTSYRFIYRYFRQIKFAKKSSNSKRYLIYGAGGAGDFLARYMVGQQDFSIVGYIDDDPLKRKQVIQGLPVLGSSEDLKSLVERHNIHSVIIAMPSVSGGAIQNIHKQCIAAKIKPLVMPSVIEIMTRKGVNLRDINISDLLKRTQKKIDIPSIQNFYKDQCVLVTGAGGSIGSELCRQIMACEPKMLIMMDASEHHLYNIDLELRKKYSANGDLMPLLGNAADPVFVDRAIEEYKPKFLLHAAAYKHVPLGEINPLSVILNNVRSTQNVVASSIKHNVSGFTLISSDKAVNSTNIMGATKRVCELLVYSTFQKYQSQCIYSSVRFGNVFGSSGSVVPLFLDQIEKGGPVTVTDPKMTRFFMSISEAVGLVLQASTKADKGKLFVLDMGEPILIKNLAERLIELNGYIPYKDIDIAFTGIRPGEKLYEELTIEGLEKPVLLDGTYVVDMHILDFEKILDSIGSLILSAQNNDRENTIKTLNEIAQSNV